MPRLTLLAALAAALLCLFARPARGQATRAIASGGLLVSHDSGDGCEAVGHCVACTSAERAKPYCAEGGGYKQQWLCAPTAGEAGLAGGLDGGGGGDVVVYRPCTGDNSALWAVLKFEAFCLCGAAASLYVVHAQKEIAFAQFRGQVVGDRLGAEHV